MNKGDRINWTPSAASGFGYGAVVPGLFVKAGPKLVQIEVREHRPFEKHPVARLRWVAKDTVSPRLLPSAAFGEPMALEVQGFELSAWKHPVEASCTFPEGTFYGQVDGYSAAAPCSSAERAVAMAHRALIGGGYEAALRSGIEHHRLFLRDGAAHEQRVRAQAELPGLEERLEKLRAAGLDRAAKRAVA